LAARATFAELKALALREPAAARAFDAIATRAHASIGRHIRELVPEMGSTAIAARASLVLAELMGHTYFDRKR